MTDIDPKSIPERYIEEVYTYHLVDGRKIVCRGGGNFGLPADYIEQPHFWAEEFVEGFEDGPRPYFVETDEDNVSHVIFASHVVSITFATKVRYLKGPDEISSALHNREIRELRERADAVEREQAGD